MSLTLIPAVVFPGFVFHPYASITQQITQYIIAGYVTYRQIANTRGMQGYMPGIYVNLKAT